MAPAQGGLYAIFDQVNKILYINASSNLKMAINAWRKKIKTYACSRHRTLSELNEVDNVAYLYQPCKEWRTVFHEAVNNTSIEGVKVMKL